MSDDAPMFSDDDDDPLLLEVVNGLLAEGKPEAEIDRHLQDVLPEATAQAATHLLDELKARVDGMFADRRHIRRGFLKRQREKWGNPLDLLSMLIEAAREAGEEYMSAGAQNQPPRGA